MMFERRCGYIEEHTKNMNLVKEATLNATEFAFSHLMYHYMMP